MSKYFVDGQDLTDIADAIREGLASTESLEFPDDFINGIEDLGGGITPTGTKEIAVTVNTTSTTDIETYKYVKIVSNVPNSYSAEDEGKVVQTGTLVAQSAMTALTNDTYNTTLYNSVVVAVPNTYANSDEGKVVSNGALVSQASTTVTTNDTYDTTLINSVTVNVSGGVTPTGTKQINVIANGTTTTDVTAYATAEVIANVPNTYSSGDEGKVVYNGALVAQTSGSVNTDGTYDTTLISSFTVNVSGGGSGVSQGTFEISAADASAYATSEYTVSSITCENGYIIVAQRQNTNGDFVWVHSAIYQNHQYLNGSNIQGGTNLSGYKNNPNCKLVNKHPVIKATNASFPLIAGTYDIIYW